MSWLLVSLAALLAFPAAASAAPISADFDESRLQLNNGIVDEEASSGTTAFTGDIDDSGNVTVPQANMQFPQFTTSTGAPVITNATTPFTGTYDGDSGELTLGGTTNVTVPVSQTAGCVFQGLVLNFSTAGEAPSEDFAGSPFIDGLDGDAGSIVASWSDLPEPTAYGGADPVCTQLDTLADGPGAFQAGNNLSVEPVSFTWDASRLQLNNGIVDETGTTSSSFEGTLDTEDGSLFIPAENVNLANFAASSANNAPIRATATEDYTGSFDEDSGELTLGGTTDVRIITSATPGGCIYTGVDLNFDTSAEAPSGDFIGAPFEDGLEGDTGSALAVINGLPDVATFGDGDPQTCATLDALADGPGAVGIGNEIVEPGPPVNPSLNPRVVPKNSKVRQGGSRVFRVYVRSQDATEPTTARVCANVPGGRRGLKLVTRRCQNVENVYTEVSKKRAVFKVRAKRSTAPKKFRLRFTATADGYDSGSVTASLKVQKKKRRRG